MITVQGDNRPKTAASCEPESKAGLEFKSGKKLLLILIAFISGAVVMIMELAGIRILAPWFGNTLFTWTGLIGVMLIALSIGYYAGGWLADIRCDYKILAHLLAVSSGAVFLIPFTNHLASPYLQNTNVLLGPVLASIMLFALPGCLLGSISPYIIRLISLLSEDRHIGLSTGTIFMFSTFGSVLGTFGAGFFLIPLIQLDVIFVISGVSIMILSAAVNFFFSSPKFNRLSMLFIVFNLVCLSLALHVKPSQDATVLYDKNNYYHRVRVFKTESKGGDHMISLYLDTSFQGARYEQSAQIPSKYQRFWALSRIFCPHLQKAAFLGGGAFVMPEAMLGFYPSLKVDVIEIDPELQEVGRQFFKIDEYPEITVITDDARRYLRVCEKKYDLIFGDVYQGLHKIPPHLVTQEFFHLVKERLNDNGVFIINLIGNIKGTDSLLFKSVLITMDTVFKHHYVFAIQPDNLEQLQNIVIVAGDAENCGSLEHLGEAERDQSVKILLSHYLDKDKYNLDGASIITDGLNPLEYLTAKSIYSRK